MPGEHLQVPSSSQSRPFSPSFGHSVDPVCPPFQHFDEEALFVSLEERVEYLRAFLDFTHEDVEALNDIIPLLEPLVEGLVDRVYAHLFGFDVTKAVFMPKPEDGDTTPMLTDLHHLRLDAPQVMIRKKSFAVYIRKLVSADYDDFATWQYFDKVGLMHTGEAALKHRRLAGKEGLFVDLMHLTALLAWTQDALIPVIMREPTMSMEGKIRTIRSLSKVMWIQNDLFSRHYTVRSHDVKAVNHALRERDDDAKFSKESDSLDARSGNGSLSRSIADFGAQEGRPPNGSGGSFGEAPKEKRSFLSRLRF